MTLAGGPLDDSSSTDGATAAARFNVQGIELIVRSNDRPTLDRVRDTYGWFAVGGRTVTGRGPLATVEVACLVAADGGATIVDADGRATLWEARDQPLIALFDAIVAGIIAALSRTGILAIHAGVVGLDGRAVLIAGRSGRGKTTLVLGLLRRGLDLMSDELALVTVDDRTILAYPRGLHIRPAALGLFPELGFLAGIEPHDLGGGSEWSVGPDALRRAFGTRVTDAIPIGAVVLLDGDPIGDAEPDLSPVPQAIATMELVRGTPEAAWAFDEVLGRLPRVVGDIPCARIRSGRLEDTVDAVLDFAASTARVAR